LSSPDGFGNFMNHEFDALGGSAVLDRAGGAAVPEALGRLEVPDRVGRSAVPDGLSADGLGACLLGSVNRLSAASGT
jgi:hypothetical protein